jgi:hypothetical protein
MPAAAIFPSLPHFHAPAPQHACGLTFGLQHHMEDVTHLLLTPPVPPFHTSAQRLVPLQLDISQVVIDQMQAAHAHLGPACEYVLGDCRDMSMFTDCQFWGAIDKVGAVHHSVLHAR